MKTIKHKIHKLLFPKYSKALEKAVFLANVYAAESPMMAKREVANDILDTITRCLK